MVCKNVIPVSALLQLVRDSDAIAQEELLEQGVSVAAKTLRVQQQPAGRPTRR